MGKEKKNLEETIIGDEDIIRQVLNGDTNAYEYLIKKYKELVFGIVKKHIPYDQREELAHEVFVKAYQSLPSFKKKSNFRRWLSSIAVRTCYDFWRKRYQERELPISSLSEKQQNWLETTLETQSKQSFHELDKEHDAREVLDWALDRLSSEERIVLELVYLEGFSGEEAANLLGWSVTNVRVRAFRARRKLQKLLMNMTTEQSELVAKLAQQAKEKKNGDQKNIHYRMRENHVPRNYLL